MTHDASDIWVGTLHSPSRFLVERWTDTVKNKKNLLHYVEKRKKNKRGSLIKLILAFFNFFFQKDSKKYYSPGAFVLTTL